MENFFTYSTQFFSLLEKQEKDDPIKRNQKLGNNINKSQMKIYKINEIIKKIEKKEKKNLHLKYDNNRDKTVSNFRLKNKQTISDFTQNLYNIKSCEKRETKKLNFNPIEKGNNFGASFNNNFNQIDKILKIKKKIINSNIDLKSTFKKFENSIIKYKKAIFLLKTAKNKTKTDFQLKFKFLKDKLDHFIIDNDFLKKELSQKETNLEFFKIEFFKLNNYYLNKNTQIKNITESESDHLLKTTKSIFTQKKFFSKIIQTDSTNYDVDKLREKKINKKFIKKNYEFSQFTNIRKNISLKEKSINKNNTLSYEIKDFPILIQHKVLNPKPNQLKKFFLYKRDKEINKKEIQNLEILKIKKNYKNKFLENFFIFLNQKTFLITENKGRSSKYLDLEFEMFYVFKNKKLYPNYLFQNNFSRYFNIQSKKKFDHQNNFFYINNKNLSLEGNIYTIEQHFIFNNLVNSTEKYLIKRKVCSNFNFLVSSKNFKKHQFKQLSSNLMMKTFKQNLKMKICKNFSSLVSNKFSAKKSEIENFPVFTFGSKNKIIEQTKINSGTFSSLLQKKTRIKIFFNLFTLNYQKFENNLNKNNDKSIKELKNLKIFYYAKNTNFLKQINYDIYQREKKRANYCSNKNTIIFNRVSNKIIPIYKITNNMSYKHTNHQVEYCFGYQNFKILIKHKNSKRILDFHKQNLFSRNSILKNSIFGIYNGPIFQKLKENVNIFYSRELINDEEKNLYERQKEIQFESENIIQKIEESKNQQSNQKKFKFENSVLLLKFTDEKRLTSLNEETQRTARYLNNENCIYIQKYLKIKSRFSQLNCVFRMNDLKKDKIILDLTTKLNEKKDNPGKLHMMKELLTKMEIEMEFLGKKLEKVSKELNPEEYTLELENRQKKMKFVIKNLQEKLKKSNQKLIKMSQKDKYLQEKFLLTIKLLEFMLLNFLGFNYKDIESLHSSDSLYNYEQGLKKILVLIENSLSEINKEKCSLKDNCLSNKNKDAPINYLINDYLKKTIIMKNEINLLKKEQNSKNKFLSSLEDFIIEKEQIKNSFKKFFIFIKQKKFKDLQITCKIILDLIDLNKEEKNEILDILVNIL